MATTKATTAMDGIAAAAAATAAASAAVAAAAAAAVAGLARVAPMDAAEDRRREHALHIHLADVTVNPRVPLQYVFCLASSDSEYIV